MTYEMSEETQAVCELIKIGNQAKNYGEFDLANVAFACALESYFGLEQGEKEATSEEPPAAWLEWETQDDTGEYPQEVYYDLLAVWTAESTPDGYQLDCLCIPVPLLDRDAAITALKSASIVEREARGGREIQEDVPSENIERLWQMLYDLQPKNFIVFAAQKCLDDEILIEIVASKIEAEQVTPA